VSYALESDGDRTILDDLQWADWDQDGRLLAATVDGRLQHRRLHSAGAEIITVADLSELAPAPVPAPDWARRW
jgi:hypothetical protein